MQSSYTCKAGPARDLLAAVMAWERLRMGSPEPVSLLRAPAAALTSTTSRPSVPPTSVGVCSRHALRRNARDPRARDARPRA